MTRPERRDRREPFTIRNPQTGLPETGWIVDGPCGGHHLTGPDYSWWQCQTCRLLGIRQRRAQTRTQLQQAHTRMTSLYYPDKDPA